MIKAFKNISEKSDVKLVFLGHEDFFLKKLKKQVSKLIDKGKIVFIENADDKTLGAYYKNAVCLIRPSLMEGFSLPPLEALVNNCLVLASDIPVHREIFEDSLIYFNPNDERDLEEKMRDVLNLDNKTREELVKKGKNIVKKFSWEDTAHQTLKVYESSTSASSV